MKNNLHEVLGDQLWHPILSPIRFSDRQPMTFWVSEVPEAPFTLEDHSQAQCFRVDYRAEQVEREKLDIDARGRATQIPIPHTLRLLIFGEAEAYVKLELNG